MLALPTLEAPQLWSWHLGPGCSGPGPALHVGSPAWLHRSWAPCARCPCAARFGVLELSTLALPMLAALTAVVTQLASRARML
jgi:hypothetical protein